VHLLVALFCFDGDLICSESFVQPHCHRLSWSYFWMILLFVTPNTRLEILFMVYTLPLGIRRTR